MTTTYDALVIGSGTAGQTAAHELNRSGLKTGLVEHSSQPGGTCALSGCQAKKWFYEGAETVARSRHLGGIGIATPAVASWQDLRDAKNRFTRRVPSETVDNLEKAGIDYIDGRARFTGRRAMAVDGKQVKARFIVLATGATPMPLPIDGAHVVETNREFMERQDLPERILFIGGGFIAFEFAHFAVRLGPKGTRCTILEAASRPLKPFDADFVELLVNASAEADIEVHTGVEITAVQQNGSAFTVKTKSGRRFETDLVVHGAGRVPALEDLALDRAGIETSAQGIVVNEKMQTTNANVYAAGDCAATVQLARVADAEAQTAAANIARMLGKSSDGARMDYRAVPAVLFTYPQYGMVGATEQELRKDEIAYRKNAAHHLDWPTYRRVGMPSAAFKVLVGKENGLILGAHVLSDNATGLINTFTLAMRNRIPVQTLYRHSIMSPYPSRESDMIYMLKPFV